MGDRWLVRVDEEDGPKYLCEFDSSLTVLVPWPEDAMTFTNAGAKRAIRKLGIQARAVRQFEEIRNGR